jgi:hypothetical protein
MAVNSVRYGNLEIMVEGMNEIQLAELVDFITEKVESMGLTLVARSYISSDDEDPPVEDLPDAEDPTA